MATRSPRDRPPSGTSPKLTARVTAAGSSARAARSGTAATRGLPAQPPLKTSPARAPPSPNTLKPRSTLLQRNTQKVDTKADGRSRSFSHDVDDRNVQENKVDPHKIQPETITSEQTIASNTADTPNTSDQNKTSDDSSTQEIHTEEKTAVIAPRPRTPGGAAQAKSRPQTPRASSRPSTPAHPAAGRGADSRPSTAGARTPASAPAPPPSLHQSSVRGHALVDDTNVLYKSDPESLRSMFDSKKKQFNLMKKELDIKQQNVMKAFDQLRSLKDRLDQHGVTDTTVTPQDLVVLNVTDWATQEIAQWCKEPCIEEVEKILNTAPPIDESIVVDISARMMEIPASFADLCLQAFTARQDIIDWVKELALRAENGSGESIERIAKFNTEGLDLCEALRDLKGRADEAVATVIELTKRMCRDHCMLMDAGESLVRQVARLGADCDSRVTAVEADSNSKGLEELRQELEEERAARAALKEKLVSTETQFKSMRARVAKMDKQLHEADATIATLTSTVKSLEDQNRQRELQLEARARKLRDSLKTGEMASNELQQQRAHLQDELQDLKEQMANATAKHKATVKELTEQVKQLKSALEEAHTQAHQEVDKRLRVENALSESEKRVEELKEQIAQIEKRLPNPNIPTQREMNLWAELQSTKETLRMTEEEITFCKKEKIRFLETLSKITNTENKIGMQQKLAAELLSKEELLGNMQSQIRDLKKSIKYNEQKVIQYEKYVHELQAHNNALVEGQESPEGMTYQELHQQIIGLRMSLLEAAQRNEELAEIVAQKEQELEQQDKTSRSQARVIKVREELIMMLKNKETEQTHQLTTLQQDLEYRMKVVDEVNNQIKAKAEEIQELFTTLENKQQQIHRLEKIILALEEQQRRAQTQRTRHEEKIAALEHELAANSRRTIELSKLLSM